MHHRAAAVIRVDLHRGVDAAGRGDADDVGAFAPGCLDDPGRGHHDAEVDHFEIVTLQHDADDVLADVVDIALDGRHHDLAGGAAAVSSNPVGEIARLLLF